VLEVYSTFRVGLTNFLFQGREKGRGRRKREGRERESLPSIEGTLDLGLGKGNLIILVAKGRDFGLWMTEGRAVQHGVLDP
jgi:hypothetical protein